MSLSISLSLSELKGLSDSADCDFAFFARIRSASGRKKDFLMAEGTGLRMIQQPSKNLQVGEDDHFLN